MAPRRVSSPRTPAGRVARLARHRDPRDALLGTEPPGGLADHRLADGDARTGRAPRVEDGGLLAVQVADPAPGACDVEQGDVGLERLPHLDGAKGRGRRGLAGIAAELTDHGPGAQGDDHAGDPDVLRAGLHARQGSAVGGGARRFTLPVGPDRLLRGPTGGSERGAMAQARRKAKPTKPRGYRPRRRSPPRRARGRPGRPAPAGGLPRRPLRARPPQRLRAPRRDHPLGPVHGRAREPRHARRVRAVADAGRAGAR